MRLSITRENGFLGFYWYPAMRSVFLTLSSQFGIRLSLGSSRERDEEFAKQAWSTLDDSARLRMLTDNELVLEVATTDAAEEQCVLEMMDRFSPNWFKSET